MGIVILGLGNPLYSDEGIGIHLVSQLIDSPLATHVEVVDGGTDGLALMPIIEEADKLIILDAVRWEGKKPGEVVVLHGEEIPMVSYQKMSQHQFGFGEALALCKFREQLPQEMVLIGVIPQSIEWGTEITPTVHGAIPEIMSKIGDVLQEWEALVR